MLSATVIAENCAKADAYATAFMVTGLEQAIELCKSDDIEAFFIYADENGDLITMLKGNVHLSDWMTRNHREPRDFNFYLVLKTLTDSPEVEPFPMGYIVVK